jgi:hypothetical protein
MACVKDDASTDIEALVERFAKDMTDQAAELRKARLEKQKKGQDTAKNRAGKMFAPASVPVVTFSLSQNKIDKSRTPAEQAKEVVKGHTRVCWSAHMADRARHVIMRVDGKVSWEPEKALGEDFKALKGKWDQFMEKYGLKNYEGRDGWPARDQFHLELSHSKIARTDVRSRACLDEYARLTREKGQQKNAKFEKDYEKLVEPYIEKYEKANK